MFKAGDPDSLLVASHHSDHSSRTRVHSQRPLTLSSRRPRPKNRGKLWQAISAESNVTVSYPRSVVHTKRPAQSCSPRRLWSQIHRFITARGRNPQQIHATSTTRGFLRRNPLPSASETFSQESVWHPGPPPSVSLAGTADCP